MHVYLYRHVPVDRLSQELGRGMMYFHKHDKHDRPLIVLHIARMPQQITPADFDKYTRMVRGYEQGAIRHFGLAAVMPSQACVDISTVYSCSCVQYAYTAACKRID